MWRALAYLAVAAVVIGCGGSDATRHQLHDEMVGVWVTDHDGAYKVFNDDGTYGAAFTIERARGNDPAFPALEWGTWALDGNVVSLVTAPDVPYCTEVPGTYEIEITDDGNRMIVTLIEDECWYRAQDFGSSMTRHIEPST